MTYYIVFMCFVGCFMICCCGLLCLCLCDRRSAEQQCIGIGSGDRLCGCIIHFLNFCILYWNYFLYDICVLCGVLWVVDVASCGCVCVWMWEKGDGGDGDGPIAAVSDYVELLRLGLIQQAADERISWLESQFQGLVHKKSKDGKPSVVGIAQFLKLPIGGSRRRRAETGRAHIQHHKQVDWRSAGQ